MAVEGFRDRRGRRAATGIVFETMKGTNYTVGLVEGKRYQSQGRQKLD